MQTLATNSPGTGSDARTVSLERFAIITTTTTNLFDRTATPNWFVCVCVLFDLFIVFSIFLLFPCVLFVVYGRVLTSLTVSRLVRVIASGWLWLLGFFIFDFRDFPGFCLFPLVAFLLVYSHVALDALCHMRACLGVAFGAGLVCRLGRFHP